MVLRDNKDFVMVMLEVFVYDLFINWCLLMNNVFVLDGELMNILVYDV